MVEVSVNHLMLVLLDSIKVVLSATLLVLPVTLESVQFAGKVVHLVGLILEHNARRSLMAELLVFHSILVHQDIINLVLFAIQIARPVIMESVQFAGNPVHLVGLMKVPSAVLTSISTVKDAVVLSSVVVITAELDTLMMVAHAEDHPKLWLNQAMAMAPEAHWVALLTKIKMEHSAIQNVKLVTPESVQSAGKPALQVTPILEQPA